MKGKGFDSLLEIAALRVVRHVGSTPVKSSNSANGSTSQSCYRLRSNFDAKIQVRQDRGKKSLYKRQLLPAESATW